jgi:hypothetical protein
MSLLAKNPWGEFKRRHPADAENIASLSLQTVSIIVVIVCAYYALKYKPFHSVSFEPSERAVSGRHRQPSCPRQRTGDLTSASLPAFQATIALAQASR